MNFQNSYKGKKVLVTGHTGFKGSWLTIWLLELGAEVIGYSLDPKNSNDLFNLSKIGNKILDYRKDIRQLNELISVIDIEKPEIVFHLAAQPLVLESYNTPLYTFETNTIGTLNVLEAIRLTNSVKTAIFITTDKVYENKEWIWPYREDEQIGGYDPYSASKGACELIISSYRNSFFNAKNSNSHQVSIASARAGNVIGGGDWSSNRIIPDCIKAIQDRHEIHLRNPEATRPWQHVLEPLGGYLLLGHKMVENPLNYSQAWNFGPEFNNIIPVKTLVEKLIKVYGEGYYKSSKPKKYQKHEANLLSLDINKAKTFLEWEPLLSIDQTITLTAEWYKNYTNTDVLELTKNQINYYCEIWKSKSEN